MATRPADSPPGDQSLPSKRQKMSLNSIDVNSEGDGAEPATDSSAQVPDIDSFMDAFEASEDTKNAMRIQFTKMWKKYNLSLKDAVGFMDETEAQPNLARLADNFFKVETILMEDFDMDNIFQLFLRLRYGWSHQEQEERGSWDSDLDWVVGLYAELDVDARQRRLTDHLSCYQAHRAVEMRSRGQGSVNEALDYFVERETKLRKTTTFGTPEDRRAEWARRRDIGARIADVVDKCDKGILLFAPPSMEITKVSAWPQEFSRILGHCLGQRSLRNIEQINALSKFCSARMSPFLRINDRSRLIATIDEICTFYVGIVFRTVDTVGVDMYHRKILQLPELPVNRISITNICIRMADLHSLVEHSWPSPNAGDALMAAIRSTRLDSEAYDHIDFYPKSMHQFNPAAGTVDGLFQPSGKWGREEDEACFVPIYQPPLIADADHVFNGSSWYLLQLDPNDEAAKVFYYHPSKDTAARQVCDSLAKYIPEKQRVWYSVKSTYTPILSNVHAPALRPQDQLFALLQHIIYLSRGEVVPVGNFDSSTMRKNSVLDLFDFIIRDKKYCGSEPDLLTKLDANIKWQYLIREF